MKYPSDFSLWNKDWRLEPQLQKEIEERQKELSKINEQLKSSKHYFRNNHTLGESNPSQEDLLLKLRKSQLELEIGEHQKKQQELYQSRIPRRFEDASLRHSRQLDDREWRLGLHNRGRQENENTYPEPDFRYVDPTLREDSNQFKNYNSGSSNTGGNLGPLFLLILVLMIGLFYVTSDQGSSKKKQPNRQSSIKDVPALLVREYKPAHNF